jgi:hypothetical protein
LIENPEGELFTERTFIPAKLLPGATDEIEDDLLAAAILAFDYFFHKDSMNSKIHAGEVRFSPITFKLANALRQYGALFGNERIDAVIEHDGKYEQDKGR